MIRILLAEMPPMLHDIVRGALINQSDMQIVGDLKDGDVLHAFENGEFDVVIIGAREPDNSEVASRLLLTSPRSKVLVIATSGRSAVMYELRPEKRLLGDVSPQTLVDAVRRDL